MKRLSDNEPINYDDTIDMVVDVFEVDILGRPTKLYFANPVDEKDVVINLSKVAKKFERYEREIIRKQKEAEKIRFLLALFTGLLNEYFVENCEE